MPAQSHAFPYRQRAWFEPRRDAGARPRALRDTLVLEYQPYDPAGAAGAAEHYYLALGAGWYEWERSGFLDFFNRLRRVQHADGSHASGVGAVAVRSFEF